LTDQVIQSLEISQIVTFVEVPELLVVFDPLEVGFDVLVEDPSHLTAPQALILSDGFALWSFASPFSSSVTVGAIVAIAVVIGIDNFNFVFIFLCGNLGEVYLGTGVANLEGLGGG
jgi:hypothetical protein